MAGTPKDRTTPTPGTALGGRQAGAAAHHHGGAERGYPAGGLPGHSLRGRLPRRGRRIPGAAGYPAGGYVRGATGRTWRGGYRGGRIYPAAGYRGKQGGCSPNVGGYRARATSGGAGGLPVPGRIPGGLYRERGYPRRAAAGGAAAQLPPAGRLPRRATGRNAGDQRGRLVTGIRHLRSPWAATPAGLPAGGAQKNIFCRGGYRGQNPGGYPLRAYIRSPF